VAIGFLGGTGPQGRGLGLRFAIAGQSVLLGSRGAERARHTAAGLSGLSGPGVIRGGSNADVAAQCDVVFVTVPYEGQRATLEPLGAALSGKLVVNCVNALGFSGGPHALAVEAGSAAEECRDLLPGARVTAAFHTVSAAKLIDPAVGLEGDVLVCGDDADDRQRVVELANAIPGLRGLHSGLLRHSGTLEAVTAMLIFVNKHYRTNAGIRLTGVDAGFEGERSRRE